MQVIAPKEWFGLQIKQWSKGIKKKKDAEGRGGWFTAPPAKLL